MLLSIDPGGCAVQLSEWTLTLNILLGGGREINTDHFPKKRILRIRILQSGTYLV